MNTRDGVHDVCHMKTKVDHESFNWLGTDHLIYVTQCE